MIKDNIPNSIQGTNRIANTFTSTNKQKPACIMPYICGGYTNAKSTTSICLAVHVGGSDIIKLGTPCHYPFADGTTIKNSHRVDMYIKWNN